jgi:hypothetical protein
MNAAYNPEQGLIDFLHDMGYSAIRKLPDGTVIGLRGMFYTTGLFFGLDRNGYSGRYCFEKRDDALAAAREWDGSGHPPGPWIKRKGGGDDDLLGPGATA